MRPKVIAISGSIPACAGEPRRVSVVRLTMRVYPRVCGGAVSTGNLVNARPGLSPRVRGSPVGIINSTNSSGSIPACAGEPSPYDLSIRHLRVYPRVCGGATAPDDHLTADEGLSPRVRGSRGRRSPACRRSGSIPACAGEPKSCHPVLPSGRVYPRVCGGAFGGVVCALSTLGLSPRVRGSPTSLGKETHHSGSIPACAGEPQPALPIARPGWVYPRVCGGAPARTSGVAITPGLSPRVRGSHRTAARRRHHQGSIPACAGEPCL